MVASNPVIPLLLASSLSYLGLCAWGLCLLSLVALHLLATRLHPMRDFVSQYALTPYGRLYSLQAICSGLAAVCLLVVILERGIPVPGWGLGCLLLYAGSRWLIPAFPMDRHGHTTRTGRIHLLLAATTFIGIVGATVGLTPSLTQQAPWNDLALLLRAAKWMTIVSSLAFLIAYITRRFDQIIGLIERCIYLGSLTWLGTLLIGLLR